MALVADQSSYIDPNGRLYWSNGVPIRAVAGPLTETYRTLLSDGTVDRLVDRFGLVPTEIAPTGFHGLEADLVLKHKPIWPNTLCVEWCPSMLRQAGIQQLELALELLNINWTLQDAYPWNTLFDGHNPVFVDFTSMVPVNETWLWAPYEQYQSYFLRPLRLARMGKWDVARWLLLDNIRGLDRASFLSMATLGYRLTHPGDTIAAWIDAWLQRNSRLKDKAQTVVAQNTVTSATARRAFLEQLLRKTKSLEPPPQQDVWSRYYSGIPPSVDREAKLRVVSEILERTSPATLLDLGSNAGIFSIRAAEAGASVVAVDSSVSCMESLYRESSQRDLSITPVVSDVLCPTPPFGFLGQQYRPLFERVRCQAVLCLGLMHHLHVAGRQSFERIAELLSACCEKHLIFEFVDRNDDNIRLIKLPRDIDYSLDDVLTALSAHFSIAEVKDSDRPSRKIVLGEKR